MVFPGRLRLKSRPKFLRRKIRPLEVHGEDLGQKASIRNQLGTRTAGSGTLAPDGDLGRISAKCGDVFLQPAKPQVLIFVVEIASPFSANLTTIWVMHHWFSLGEREHGRLS